MPELGGISFKFRIISVHILYILYSSILWLKLVELGEQTGHPKSETQLALIIWTVVFVIFHLLIAYSGLSGSPHNLLQQTWMSSPMLVFMIFLLIPYGFTLKHMYTAIDVKQFALNNGNTTTCIANPNVPMYDFILLQMVMPVMLLTFIVYPLPRRAYTYSEYIAIGMEFVNAFDTMDMIGDLEFVRHYGNAWESLFYISLGVTAILVAFPVKIESEDIAWPRRVVVCSHSEPNVTGLGGGSMTSILDAPIVFETDVAIERVYKNNNAVSSTASNLDKLGIKAAKSTSLPSLMKTPSSSVSPDYNREEQNIQQQDNTRRVSLQVKKNTLERLDIETSKTRKKVVKVLLTVIFTDAFFAMLRFKIMVEEKSAVHGFNMFVKNVILMCLHLSYLLQHVHSLIVVRLSRDM